jgi:hypothetical protein
MPIVGVMQVTVDEIVNMIAMRYCRMPTVGTMNVGRFMSTTAMSASAFAWVGGTHLQRMFFNDTGRCLVMEMTIVKKIHMIPMLDRCVTTVFSMNMTMIFVIMRHVPSS